jgi:hypothetical protein
MYKNPIEIELQVYDKHSIEVINPFLNSGEVACNCQYQDCNRVLISSRTEKSFYLVREHYGAPIIINSGYRCQRHNADVGGVVNSYHMIGTALDIRPLNSDDYNSVLNLAEKFFDVVIPYKSKGFIHVHNLG